MVAADGREWGLECPSATIDVGEKLAKGRQRNNTSLQRPGLTRAGKAVAWQNSAIFYDSLLRGLKMRF